MNVEQEQRFIIDRVGEETDLEECSLCFAASCFSCVSDHCTALKKLADGGCGFYKSHEENHKEIWRCFYRLIRFQRFDLLTKYSDRTLKRYAKPDDALTDWRCRQRALVKKTDFHEDVPDPVRLSHRPGGRGAEGGGDGVQHAAIKARGAGGTAGTAAHG